MGPLAAAASTFKMFGSGPTFARPNRWGGAKARAAAVAGGKKLRVSWVCRECADAFMHEHAEKFTLGMVHQAKHRQTLIEHASATACKNGHEKGTSHLCKWIDVVAALKYRREKAATMGIEFKGGDAKGPVSRATAKDPVLAKELKEVRKELAQYKRNAAMARGEEVEEEDDTGFFSDLEDEETAEAEEPPPKVNVQQIQTAIARAKGQLRMERQEVEPDQELVKKFESRIKSYEAQIAQATPPDKRAKEIETRLIAFESTAKNKKASAEKNRKEAERLSKLAEQEEDEAKSKATEMDELKQQLKDIRGELGAQLHLKGTSVINVSTKALIESFPDEAGANEIRAKARELEAAMATYANGVATHAAAVLRGEIKITGETANAIMVDVPDSEPESSDDDSPVFVEVPIAPEGRELTREEWAAYGEKQKAQAAKYKEREAKRKERRKKKEGERKAVYGKLRATASSSDNKVHITPKK